MGISLKVGRFVMIVTQKETAVALTWRQLWVLEAGRRWTLDLRLRDSSARDDSDHIRSRSSVDSANLSAEVAWA